MLPAALELSLGGTMGPQTSFPNCNMEAAASKDLSHATATPALE